MDNHGHGSGLIRDIRVIRGGLEDLDRDDARGRSGGSQIAFKPQQPRSYTKGHESDQRSLPTCLPEDRISCPSSTMAETFEGALGRRWLSGDNHGWTTMDTDRAVIRDNWASALDWFTS